MDEECDLLGANSTGPGGGGGGGVVRTVTVTSTQQVIGTTTVGQWEWQPDRNPVWEWDSTREQWTARDRGSYHWRSWRVPFLVTVAIARKVFVGDEETASEPILSGRDLVSIGVGTIPVVGTIQSAVEFVTGCDYIAGERVHCGLAAVGLVAGMVPGGKGALKVAVKGIGKFVRGDRIVLTDDLIGAANQRINEEGLTKAGRALDKPAQGQRETGTFPPLRGGIEARNAAAAEIVEGILRSCVSASMHGRRGYRLGQLQEGICRIGSGSVVGIGARHMQRQERGGRAEMQERRRASAGSASPFVHQRWRVIPVEEK